MTWWIAQNVVVTAALALVVAVACRLLRVGPVARHALWVLVLIKFITPQLVVWPWALPDPLGLSVESRAIEGEPIADASGRRLGDVILAQYESLPTSNGATILQRRAAEPAPSDLTVWLLAVWITGSVFLLGLEALRVWRLHRRVSSGSAPDEALDDRVRALARSLSAPYVRVRVVEGISSPMIWAAGRPQLLWPADLPPDSSDACIDGLIVHELAHIRRRDHVIGWIELAAGVVWWWNPLFWFVRASRREQAELACDAWVISVLPNGRRAYAESLLALSGGERSRTAPSMAVVGIRATSRRVLERRLVMIMKGSTPLRLPVMGIAGLAFAAAMTLPAWAMSSQPQVATAVPQTQAPPPPPPVTVPATAAQSAPKPPQPTIAVVVEPPTTAPAPVTVAVSVPKPSFSVNVQPTIAIASPPAMPSRSISVAAQQATPPPPPPTVTATSPPRLNRSETVTLVPKREVAALPAEGQKLLTQFDADREQMQKDLASRIEARRQDLIKQLEALQEQFTKAGKLDEAIAVRNYLRGVKGAR